MKDNTFDQLLKQKLEQLTAPKPEDAWEAFEQKLDASEPGVPQPEDTLIDQIVFDKLHQYEAVRPNSGWHLLRHRMNTRTATTYRVASWKTAEAVILSLLLLLVTRLSLPTGSTTIPRGGERSGQSASQQEHRQAYNPTALPVPSAQPGKPNPHKTAIPKTGAEKSLPEPTTAPSSPLVIPNLPVKRQKAVPETSTRLIKPDNLVAPPRVALNRSDAKIPFLPGQQATITGGASASPPPPGLITPLSKAQLNVGMYGDIAYNRIITPPDLQNEITGFDRYSLGYGGGVLLGLKKGALEIG
ncbi:MAG TPA: hypothetical protein VJ953_20020, partial [Saprospiraceae bacterium]|nr:hypothetical protein [Saprospiraceae bacterium]